jgi:hypothetical protein
VFEANLDELRIWVVILAIVHTEAALTLMNLVHVGPLSRDVSNGARKTIDSLPTTDHFVYGPNILGKYQECARSDSMCDGKASSTLDYVTLTLETICASNPSRFQACSGAISRASVRSGTRAHLVSSDVFSFWN